MRRGWPKKISQFFSIQIKMLGLKGAVIHLVLWLGLCSGDLLKQVDGKSKLRAVSMLTRHGDRAPTISYPLDPYKDYKWPGGYGALSPKGAEQLFESGRIKSKRYSRLLASNNKHPVLKRVYLQSSAVQRCVDSASHFLDAFLPVDWPKKMLNVTRIDQDEILGTGKKCPYYEHELTEGAPLNNPELKSIIDIETEQGMQIIEFIEKNSGLNITNSMDLILLADTLDVQKENQLELPAWADYAYRNYFHPILSIGTELIGESRYMEIHSGGLLRDIIVRLGDYLNGRSSENVLFYSGHDVNISGLLHILGVLYAFPDRPEYGSVISVELYENSSLENDLEVKIIYFKNYGDENPTDIEIPECNAPCPFRKFEQLVRPKFIYDYDLACNI